MSKWELRHQISGVWSAWADITSPQTDITVERISTRTKHPLYNGTIGRRQPTTKYNYDNVDMEWSYLSATNSLISSTAASGLSLIAIVSGGWLIEIKTHTLYSGNTETFQGYIVSHPKMYKVGMFRASDGTYQTFYDISITFDVISVT